MPNFLKNFKAALQYANFDFYKLKKEIIVLIKKGREQGFDNPDYCKVTIKNSSIGRDYPVSIDLYYKLNNEEVIYLPQQLIIGCFATIPTSIKQTLVNDGFVEIVINNFTELSISATEEVSKPIKFDSILNFNSSHYQITSRIVTIKDDIFAYRVIYKYDTPAKKGEACVVTYADITDIPDDIALKMKSEGHCSITIDEV